MPSPLDSRATAASDAGRTLERALADARTQWNDSARQAFDQKYADPITGSARSISAELSGLSRELADALRELRAAL